MWRPLSRPVVTSAARCTRPLGYVQPAFLPRNRRAGEQYALSWCSSDSALGFSTSASSTAPLAASPAADAAGYPEGSHAQDLLNRCLEAAAYRGGDVKAPYEPWLPVDLMQTLLIDIHDAVGCSWLASIMLTCVGIRVVTLPISIAAIRGAREKAIIQPQFQELVEKQKAVTAEGNQDKIADITKKLQAFQQKHGRFFMLKGTWNLICFQMPLYITAFAAMRGFATHPDVFRGFAMEAPLWLDSLALADPYALLPMFTAAIMLTNTELFGSIDTEVASAAQLESTKTSNLVAGTSTFQKYQKWIMRGSAVFFVPMTWNFPAGVFVFMSTNLIVATTQNRILRLPVLERLLEIPPTAESVKAANEAAATTGGLPSLIPVFNTLTEARKRDEYERAKRATPATPRPAAQDIPLLLPETVSLSASSQETMKKALTDLQVSPQYAVKRARPTGAGMATG
mmetsp:Transcript_99591/g.181669  ORF Transcript_99591/g.181669 Transcript_99591/m.181669 type:complete len:455 (-) Transcript_99591:15-1379(-)